MMTENTIDGETGVSPVRIAPETGGDARPPLDLSYRLGFRLIRHGLQMPQCLFHG